MAALTEANAATSRSRKLYTAATDGSVVRPLLRPGERQHSPGSQPSSHAAFLAVEGVAPNTADATIAEIRTLACRLDSECDMYWASKPGSPGQYPLPHNQSLLLGMSTEASSSLLGNHQLPISKAMITLRQADRPKHSKRYQPTTGPSVEDINLLWAKEAQQQAANSAPAPATARGGR